MSDDVVSSTGAASADPSAERVRRRLATSVILGALLLAVAWSWVTLSASRQTAMDAASDLSACREAASRIDQLRRRPAVAGSREVQATELSRRIEESARAAGMPEGGLDQIEPEPLRRVGDTPYRQTPTRVRLRQVTLQQLFTFLHALAAEGPSGPGLRLQALRLSAPRGEEAGDQWTAEATLTYLVYDPKSGPLGTNTNGPVSGAIAGR
jgi:hypothetical protein